MYSRSSAVSRKSEVVHIMSNTVPPGLAWGLAVYFFTAFLRKPTDIQPLTVWRKVMSYIVWCVGDSKSQLTRYMHCADEALQRYNV